MPTDLDPPLVDKSAGSQQAPILTLALSSKIARARPRSPISSRSASSPISATSPTSRASTCNGDVKREFHVLPDPLRLFGTGATVLRHF